MLDRSAIYNALAATTSVITVMYRSITQLKNRLQIAV
jgi:hypothetical protein